MSDFLMIVPPPWVEVSNHWIVVVHTPEVVTFWISQEAWADLEVVLQDQGDVPAGKHVVDARLFQVDGGYRLWALFE